MQVAAVGLQLLNTIVVCALYIQTNDWQWWYVLLPAGGVPAAIAVIVLDKKRIVREELEFIYSKHPISLDIRRILVELNEVKKSIDQHRQKKVW